MTVLFAQHLEEQFPSATPMLLQPLPTAARTGRRGAHVTHPAASRRNTALNVAVFLGIPLPAGFLTRRIGERKMGRGGYEATFLPRIGPWALHGLLFTIVVLFAPQGRTITSQPLDVVRQDADLARPSHRVVPHRTARGATVRVTPCSPARRVRHPSSRA